MSSTVPRDEQAIRADLVHLREGRSWREKDNAAYSLAEDVEPLLSELADLRRRLDKAEKRASDAEHMRDANERSALIYRRWANERAAARDRAQAQLRAVETLCDRQDAFCVPRGLPSQLDVSQLRSLLAAVPSGTEPGTIESNYEARDGLPPNHRDHPGLPR